MKRSLFVLALFLAPVITGAGCSQQSVTVPVRSLERSEKSAFLCLGDPSGATQPGLSLDACAAVSTPLQSADFVTSPHVVSLVTQTRRGEIAVIDITSGGVVDVDPARPGYNFLPTGALPTDIVATTGSTAAFVAVGDPVRPGIFGISSFFLYPRKDHPAPTLGGFPACSLPAVPTQLLLVADRTAGRLHCDAHTDAATPQVGFDLANETAVYGRQKLLALMPDLRQIAVIDAQELLLRPAGSFDACPVEGTIALTADGLGVGSEGGTSSLTDAAFGGASRDEASLVEASSEGGDVADASAEGGDVAEASAGGGDVADASAGAGDASPTTMEGGAMACVARPGPTAPSGHTAHPAEMAYSDDGRLFVSDDEASVIHYIDLADVCAPVTRPPLLPFSAVDPSRAVVSGSIAVSPLTSDQKRFVYAVDIKDRGSVMVFDVSQDATARTPILRPDLVANPGEPQDRIAFNSPVQAVTFARHDRPLGNPDSFTGRFPRGSDTRCDPNAALGVSPYQPPTDYLSDGAGPATLRGIFGFLVLATGQMAVIDVEDYDAKCRRPQGTDDKRLGCAGEEVAASAFPSASREVSCNVVERNRPRSNSYMTNVSPLVNAPAMQAFPVLHLKDSTVLSVDPANNNTDAALRPRLLGPSLSSADAMATPSATAANALLASVSGTITTSANFTSDPKSATNNWVAFDLAEPRAHFPQTWAVTYEGVLSNFDGRRGRLQCAADRPAIECETSTAPSSFDLYDSASGFCDRGVEGASLATPAIPSGDVVQVLSDFPDPADPYWGTVVDSCSRQICEQVFGTVDNLTPARDLVIERSYQDRLSLRTSSISRFTKKGPNGEQIQIDLRPLACCFPYPVSYTVRSSKHWVVTGSASGFQHDLTTDRTGACVHSCDPSVALRQGRIGNRPVTAAPPVYATETPPAVDTSEGAQGVFRNPQLRMVLWGPQSTTCSENPAPNPAGKSDCLTRDMFFTFAEGGGFSQMIVSLSSSAAVLPQSVQYVRGLEELAIPDAATQGLILFDLNRVAATQSFF